MKVKKEKRENDTLVTVEGRLDIGSAMVLEQKLLEYALAETVFTLDFKDVEYISSAGIRALLTLYREVSTQEGSVTIINALPSVKDIMDETEFSELFNM